MKSATETPIKYRTPLRQAQRDLTRSRIKDAARTLFYERHYNSTTMDEIAVAAGLRRSTVYLHYKDKAEILNEIIADFIPRARALLTTLPGPKPSLTQIRRWIDENVRFLAGERMPFSILVELRSNPGHIIDSERLTAELLAAIGENNPRFLQAASDKADPMDAARARLLYLQMTFACEMHLQDPRSALGKAALQVAAEAFHNFLSPPD